MAKRKDLGLALAAMAISLYALFPFYWAVVTSMKVPGELFQPTLVPFGISGQSYRSILGEGGFFRSIINSVWVAATTSAVSLGLSLMASQALGRAQFRGRAALLLMILGVSMFPQIAVLSGLFELIRWLGLYNTLSGLVLGYLILVLPFTVWVLTRFFKEIPKEIEKAAILDGCGPWKMLWRVFLPLLRPALVTTGLISFIAAWNEFLFALTFTLSADKRTIPVAIAMLSGHGPHELPWGNIMAASVLVTVPLVGLVFFFQRHIVAGLTAGGVKG